MTRKVSFQVLTLIGSCLLVWMAFKAWHLFVGNRPATDYVEITVFSLSIVVVWIRSRRLQRDLDGLGGQIEGDMLERLSRNSIETGYLCYLLIYVLLFRQSMHFTG